MSWNERDVVRRVAGLVVRAGAVVVRARVVVALVARVVVVAGRVVVVVVDVTGSGVAGLADAVGSGIADLLGVADGVGVAEAVADGTGVGLGTVAPAPPPHPARATMPTSPSSITRTFRLTRPVWPFPGPTAPSFAHHADHSPVVRVRPRSRRARAHLRRRTPPPADVNSLKLGINVVNADAMRVRAFAPAVHGFLDTIRDGHPDTPIALVTPVFCGIHEATPGPGAFDPASFGTGQVKFLATGDPADPARGALTLEVIRHELASLAKRRDDPYLHLLDGLSLYGPGDDDDHPLPDALHPDRETHRLMGERFAAWAFGADGRLGSFTPA